jgi:myo-inositol-1-phosphate synthase
MFRLLAVVVAVIGTGYVASSFIGSVLEQRAIAEREAMVHDRPTGLAAAPPSLTPETKR